MAQGALDAAGNWNGFPLLPALSPASAPGSQHTSAKAEATTTLPPLCVNAWAAAWAVACAICCASLPVATASEDANTWLRIWWECWLPAGACGRGVGGLTIFQGEQKGCVCVGGGGARPQDAWRSGLVGLWWERSRWRRCR